MTHTDEAEARETRQRAAAALSQNTKDVAASTLETVRLQASAAGESIGSAVSAALDTAGESIGSAVSAALDTAKQRGREAQQDVVKTAQKQAKRQGKRAKKARQQAGKRATQRMQKLSIKAQEKAGRHPRRKRRVTVLVGVAALAGVAAASALGQRRKNQQLIVEPTVPPSGTDDPTSTPSG